jgi:hypothetical protein
MERRNYIIKKSIEQSLFGRPMEPGVNDHIFSVRARKNIMKMLTGFIVFPLIGIIGALLIWTVIRIVFGLPGYPGLH